MYRPTDIKNIFITKTTINSHGNNTRNNGPEQNGLPLIGLELFMDKIINISSVKISPKNQQSKQPD